MQNTDENIDLDALFDMLNIVPDPASEVSSTPVASQPDPDVHELQDLSPLGTDFFIIDLPSDQS